MKDNNAFPKNLDQSGHKRNKIWLDKESKLYNKLMKLWLQENDINIYSTRSDGKAVVVERFIRTLKNKIEKYMTIISKNLYIGKLVNIGNEYHNTYHGTIKIKPTDVKASIYI